MDVTPGKAERQVGWMHPKAGSSSFCSTLDLTGSIWESLKTFSTFQCCALPSNFLNLSRGTINKSLHQIHVIRNQEFPHVYSLGPGSTCRKGDTQGEMPLGGKKAPGVLLNLGRRRVTELTPNDPRRTRSSSCRRKALTRWDDGGCLALKISPKPACDRCLEFHH